MADGTDTFYGSIPVFRGFASLMDPAPVEVRARVPAKHDGTVAQTGTVEGIDSADTELPYAMIATGLSQLPHARDVAIGSRSEDWPGHNPVLRMEHLGDGPNDSEALQSAARCQTARRPCSYWRLSWRQREVLSSSGRLSPQTRHPAVVMATGSALLLRVWRTREKFPSSSVIHRTSGTERHRLRFAKASAARGLWHEFSDHNIEGVGGAS